jgi:hypothetical protein
MMLEKAYFGNSSRAKCNTLTLKGGKLRGGCQ